MKYLFSILFSILISVSGLSQIEKAGLYAGTSLVVHNYAQEGKSDYMGQGFFAIRQRIGGMASYYIDPLFSFESGLLFDYHEMPENEKLSFRYDDGLNFSLKEHNYINVGIPMSITMRTNTTRNCVTYFKLSLTNLFTILDRQSILNNHQPESLPHTPQHLNTSTNGFRYYSSDIEFGFGTFWYLKKLDAKLCLEPKVTLYQYRNEMSANHLSNRNLVISHHKVLSSLGFEVTFYKDLY